MKANLTTLATETQANYNDSIPLWESMRKSAITDCSSPVFTVTDCGHITQGGEALARCADKRSAMNILEASGWKRMSKNTLGTFYSL
jgi:hypothetical protein